MEYDKLLHHTYAIWISHVVILLIGRQRAILLCIPVFFLYEVYQKVFDKGHFDLQDFLASGAGYIVAHIFSATGEFNLLDHIT